MSKEIKNTNNFKKELTKVEQIFELEQATNTEALYGIDYGVTYIYFTEKEDHKINHIYAYNPVTNKIQKFNKSRFVDAKIEEDENGNMKYTGYNVKPFPVYKVTPGMDIIKKSEDEVTPVEISDFLERFIRSSVVYNEYNITDNLEHLKKEVHKDYKAYLLHDPNEIKLIANLVFFNTTPEINKYAAIFLLCNGHYDHNIYEMHRFERLCMVEFAMKICVIDEITADNMNEVFEK